MNRSGLLKALAFLRKGREAILSDYCTEEPRLYRPMFSHEPHSSDMNIALDKYMFSWLAQHPSHYQEIIERTKEEHSNHLGMEVDVLINAYRKLCEKFIVDDSCHERDSSPILDKVVKESIDYLDTLLTVSEKADDRLERLRYQGEKSKHLFDRALKELKKENNGIL